MIGTPHQILFCDKIEKNEMSGVYNTYGGEERCIQSLVQKREGNDNIKMDLQKVGCGSHGLESSGSG